MTQTTFIGNRGEEVAAKHIESLGYRVLDRNWRRRQCEIDIVARKGAVVYLVEVKYRQTDVAGSGLEYITGQKLRQMAYAAERWVVENNWRGEYALAAIEVSGEDFEVTSFIESIEL